MTALPLPRLSSSEAQALNAIAQGLGELSITGPGESGTALLGLVALTPGSEPPRIIDPVSVQLEWSGAQLLLQLPRRTLDYWVSETLGSGLAVLPATWRDSALLQACQWICDGLSDLGRGRAAVAGVLPEASPPAASPHCLIVRLMWPESGSVVLGLLHLDALGLLVCASLIPQGATPAISAENRIDPPMPLRLCIGETALTRARLAKIAQGDVILITEPLLTPQGGLTLVYSLGQDQPGFTIQAHLEGSLITLTASPALRMPFNMTEHDSSGDEPTSIDQVPIRLSFDLGTKTITLSELQALQPGSVFSIDRPAHEYLTIRANGAVIGSGQLVEIDGRLGVSVTRITPPGAPG